MHMFILLSSDVSNVLIRNQLQQFVVCISFTLRQVHSHGFAFLLHCILTSSQLQVVTRVAALVLIVVVVVVVVVRLNQIKVLNIALLKGTVPLHQRLQ